MEYVLFFGDGFFHKQGIGDIAGYDVKVWGFIIISPFEHAPVIPGIVMNKCGDIGPLTQEIIN
jgi:hypothetical protein